MQSSLPFHQRHEDFTDRAYATPGLLPDRYVFVLTNACNLRCPFCFQQKGSRGKRMDLAAWRRVLDQIPDYGRVTLTGGEPLLFKGFRELFAELAGRLDCNIITNGILLNEEIIDFLLSFERFRVLSVSIDDIGNRARGVSPEQWHHLERMLTYFVQAKEARGSACVLDIKTTVLDANAADLFAIHRHCLEELRSDTHVFQFLKGSPLQHADVMADFGEILQPATPHVYSRFELIQQELERSRAYNVQYGKRSFLHPKIADFTADSPLPDLAFINAGHYDGALYQPCKFPWSSVHINYDGTLFPCLAVAMGDVTVTPLAEIVNGEPMRRFREVIREQGTVQGCARCGWLRPLAPAATRGPA